MVDQILQEKRSGGKFSFFAALISAWLATYFMNYASLHGVNFELGEVVPGIVISSEAVKSTLISSAVAFSVIATPRNFVQGVSQSIIFVRRAIAKWKDAATQDLPPEDKS